MFYHSNMYETLTFYHSFTRWLVLVSLLYAIYRAWRGYFSKKTFTHLDNHVRHWTATIAHVQLVIGMVLYLKARSLSTSGQTLKMQ